MPFCISAQDEFPCAANEMFLNQIKLNPGLLKQVEQQEIKTQNQIAANAGKKTQGQIYTIPVVFHIVHNFGPENISDAVIADEMTILNEDFRKTGNRSSIVASFSGLDADCEIEFKLAQLDPSGNCTNGIDRIASTKTTLADDQSKLNQWPRNKYVNIWIVASIANGSAGGAYIPSVVASSPAIDGILVRYDYVGQYSPSTVARSHSITHEMGHILNLNHTWGTTNNVGVTCGDDGVTDTPVTKGWVNCTNLNGQVCNSGIVENVQNYMEYSYCTVRMFTADQKTRMQTALNSSISSRNNLWAATNLTATGTDGTAAVTCTPIGDFNANKKVVCLGGTVNFTDYSFNATSVTGWSWSFPGGTPSTSNLQNPSVVYTTVGKHDVSLSSSNSAGTGPTTTKTNFINVYESSGNTGPYNEGFESFTFPSTTWDVSNPDSYKTWADCNTAAATGSKSIKLDNIGNIIGEIEKAYSPTIDMTKVTAKTLTFKVAYAQYTSTDVDKLRVLVSTNCGQSYTQAYTKTGTSLKTAAPQTSGYTPALSDWRTETVNLTSYGSATALQLLFEFTFQGGNNIYIDDINIGGITGINEDVANAFDLTIFPNPLNDQSVLSFSLPEKENVKVVIRDMLGRENVVLADGELSGGEHNYPINTEALKLSQGIYFVELSAGNARVLKKLTIN